MTAPREEFDELQRRAWSHPEPSHHLWRTTNPCVARLERALLEPLAALRMAESVLDVGCGEGEVMHFLPSLGFEGRYVGIDRSQGKIEFARGRYGGERCQFAVADASRLPFRDRQFPVVFCRDMLHHVSYRADVLRELLRVAGERVLVIEPNPWAPLIGVMALLIRTERGMLDSAPLQMNALLANHAMGWRVKKHWAEPQSVDRLLVHHKLGLPALGRVGLVRAALAGVERLSRWSPRLTWNYQVFELERER